MHPDDQTITDEVAVEDTTEVTEASESDATSPESLPEEGQAPEEPEDGSEGVEASEDDSEQRRDASGRFASEPETAVADETPDGSYICATHDRRMDPNPPGARVRWDCGLEGDCLPARAE